MHVRAMNSRLLVGLISSLVLGCPETSSSDASVDAVTPVDAALPGTYACGAATCAEGEICIARNLAGFPTDGGVGGGGPAPACEPRPTECGAQGDCGRASCDRACTDAVCMPSAPFYFSELTVSDDGRFYSCVNTQDAS